MSDFEDLEKLIRLKRYEKPPDDYYDEFFSEFQARQRSEMLRQSAHGLFFERVSAWMWGLGNWRWLYAGGAAYAAVMIVVFLRPVSEMFAESDGKTTETQISEVPAVGEKKGFKPKSTESQPVKNDESSKGESASGAIREL